MSLPDPYEHLSKREHARELASPTSDYFLSVGEKVEVFARYYHAYPRAYVVETGLWEGWGTTMRYFVSWPFAGQPTVYAIDYQEENCRRARENMPAISALCGDSAELLPRLLDAKLDEPAVFWIDAHDPDMPVPLRAELQALVAWEHAAESVVLIDDVRMFGGPGFPSYDEAVTLLENVWIVENSQDILRCVPRR